MKIAILGTGPVGRTLAGRLTELGHDVTVGTRDPEATRGRQEYAAWSTGQPGIALATFPDASAGADLVVNASPGALSLDVLEAAGSTNLAGKVLVDVSNPLDFSAGFPPTLSVCNTDSLGEQIQRAHPDARVVKTLNTVTAALMVHPETLGRESTVFVSGNDDAAKRTVIDLLTAFGHEDVIDLGGITTARGPEMYLPLWLRLMGPLGTAEFNVLVVR